MAKKESNASNEMVHIGTIVGAFGLKGQVKVQQNTNIDERFDKGRTVFLDNEPRKIVESRVQKGRFIIKLDGVNKIEEAEKLQWKKLYIPADDRPELDDDEYMVDDLIGLKVITNDGTELGKVEDVLVYPAQDIIKVGDILIPAVKEFVELIDFDEEIIVVNLIEGMVPGSDLD